MPLTGSPLVAVAHGSRDARSATTVRQLVHRIRVRAPELDVRVAFLDLSEPSLPEVLAELHSDGHRDVTVVPLLLGTAYHARVDLPQLVGDVTERFPLLQVSIGDALGPDELLEAAAKSRLTDALAAAADGTPPLDRDPRYGGGPGILSAGAAISRVGDRGSGHAPGADVGFDAAEVGVVVAAVGSSHPPANAAITAIAERWDRSGGFGAVTHAFATCAPGIDTAVTRLRDRGAARVAVAPWFLAPGLLLDDIGARTRRVDPRAVVAKPLGAHDRVVDVVLRRYHAVGTAALAA